MSCNNVLLFFITKGFRRFIKGNVWTGSVGKKWNACRVSMGHLTEIESLKELNADENIVTK
jgi:hypothetical protein